MNTPPSGLSSDKVYVCGSCGSAAVTASSLVGGHGACRACSWTGPVEDLLVVPIQHTMGTPEEIKRTFHAELRNLFGKVLALPLLQFLIRWGFIGSKAPSKSSPAYPLYVQLVGRYVAAAGTGAANALLETREAVEVERRSGKGLPYA